MALVPIEERGRRGKGSPGTTRMKQCKYSVKRQCFEKTGHFVMEVRNQFDWGGGCNFDFELD